MFGKRMARTTIVLIGVAACATVVLLTWGAHAAPPGVEPGLKKVFQFNLIGRPNAFNGSCGGGSRMWVERDDHHAHIEIHDEDAGWYIEDCDATGGNRGVLVTDEVGDYVVYARILGKPGGKIDICADTLADHDAGEELCEVGTFSLNREGGKSQFSVAPSALFDAELEDLIWSIDVNKDYRISQFRVYKLED